MTEGVNVGSIRGRLTIPALLLAVLAAHGGALRNGFLYDDYHLIAENPAVLTHAWGAIWTSSEAASRDAQGRGFRPVTLSSYAIDHAIGNGRPAAYHATQVVLHAAVVWLAYVVATTLGSSPGWSAAGALLVALHPVQTEAVHYLSARSSVLSTLGLLASFWTYLRWRGQPAGRRAWRIASFLFVAVAVLSKESAAVGLIWFLAYERLISGATWSETVRRLSPHLAIAIISALPMVAVLDTRGPGAAISTGAAIATGVSVLGRHLWAWGVPWSVHPIVPQPWVDWGEPQVWGAMTLIGVSGLAMYGLRDRFRLAAWGLICGVTSLAPVLALPFVTNVALFQAHRGYQAATGFAFATVALASAWAPRASAAVRSARARRWLGAAGGGLAAIAATAAIATDVRVGRIWGDEVAFWSAAVERYPSEGAYQHSLGAARTRAGDLAGAEQAFVTAARLDEELPRVDFNLGLVYTKMGRNAEAMAAYERAIERDSTDVKALVNLGVLYERVGDPDGAVRAYTRALAIDPDLTPVRRNLARLLMPRATDGSAP